MSSVADEVPVAPAGVLPRRKIFSFALGHVLNDLCAATWFSYLLVFLHKVLGLTSTHSAIVLLSGQIADAIATPLVGIFSDKAKGITCGSFYFGRRHLWYTMGTLLVIVSFFFLFGRCVMCDMTSTTEETANTTGLVVYYALAASVFNLGWASVQVSHMALVPEMTSDETMRVVLNSARYGATVSSNLFVFLVLGVLIYGFKVCDMEQFHYLTYVCLCVGGVTSILFLIGTEERRPKREQEEYDAEQAKKRRKSRSLNDQEEYQTLPSTSRGENVSPLSPPEQQQQSSKSTVTFSKHTTLTGSAGVRSQTERTTLMNQSRAHDYGASSASPENSDRNAPLLPNGGSVDAISSDDIEMEDTVGDADATFDNTLVRRLDTLPVRFKTYRCWLNQPEFFITGWIYMCTRLVVNVSQVCLPLYVLDVAQLPTIYITFLPCTVYLSSLAAATGMKSVHHRFGMKPTFTAGFCAVMAGCIGMLFLPSVHKSGAVYLLFPCAVAIGLGNGAVMVCCGALVSEMIGSRTNYAAFVFGSFSFGDKLVTGIVLFLLQTFNPDDTVYMRFAATLPTIGAAIAAIVATLWLVDIPAWRYKHTLPVALGSCFAGTSASPPSATSTHQKGTSDLAAIEHEIAIDAKEDDTNTNTATTKADQ